MLSKEIGYGQANQLETHIINSNLALISVLFCTIGGLKWQYRHGKDKAALHSGPDMAHHSPMP
jgi:hypothetical protein